MLNTLRFITRPMCLWNSPQSALCHFSTLLNSFYQQTNAQFDNSNSLLRIMPGPGDPLYKPGGYFGVQSVCLHERDIRSQTGPSVVQLGRLNEISDSNINSSASLMRTMRGNCFSKERHYGSSWGDRAALFTKVIGHRGLETVHHTSLHFALLCSTQLLYPQGSFSGLFISLIFWNKDPKENCTSGIWRPWF